MANKTYDLTKVITTFFFDMLSEEKSWIFGSDSLSSEKEILIDSSNSKEEFLRQAIFGVKVSSSDISYLIPEILWSEGTIYSKYDDTKDLKKENFYVIVEPQIESGDYEVFKCLSNNNGVPSLVKPISSNLVNVIDGIYKLSDGYVWKFMGVITNSQYRKFSTNGKVPINASMNSASVLNDGISFIEIENRTENRGYVEVNGTINRRIPGTKTFILNTSSDFISALNYYAGMSLYVVKPSGVSQLYNIIASSVNNNENTVEVEEFNSSIFNPAFNDTIQILPRIIIEGNGTGSIAIPVLESSSIRDIIILNSGSGYTSASAKVIDPSTFDPLSIGSTDTRCVLRPIIGPDGGHGSNIVEELYCSSIGVSTIIDSTAPSNITDQNTYSKIALVDNPSFSSPPPDITFDNRIRIEIDGTLPSGVQVGDEVVQIVNGNPLSGIIHEIETSSIFYISNHSAIFDEDFTSSNQIEIENQLFNINSLEKPLYIKETGSIFYFTSFNPINRSSDKSEQIKFAINF